MMKWDTWLDGGGVPFFFFFSPLPTHLRLLDYTETPLISKGYWKAKLHDGHEVRDLHH